MSNLVLEPTIEPEAAATSARQRVISHQGGPLLVLAGPGTGKTSTIVDAVAARMTAPTGALAAPQILVLTFAHRAAGELRVRLARRLGGGLLPAVSTFHSFANSVIREFGPQAGGAPRLLSASEQELRLRELLENSVRERRINWPSDLRASLGTLELSGEVRRLIANARTAGMCGSDLIQRGVERSKRSWIAVGQFMDEYLDVLDAEGVIDYCELVARGATVAESPAAVALRRRYHAIFVDEYQDTDEAQVRLLRALVTPATHLVAVGDPDQAIFRFRGADVRSILEFRDIFQAADSRPAPVVVLDETFRFGQTIRVAADRVIGAVSVSGRCRLRRSEPTARRSVPKVATST